MTWRMSLDKGDHHAYSPYMGAFDQLVWELSVPSAQVCCAHPSDTSVHHTPKAVKKFMSTVACSKSESELTFFVFHIKLKISKVEGN